MPSDIAESLRPLAVQIDSLTLLPGNPRRGDIDAVARSYERFGQRKPIVARRDGTVIAGNHQLQAARQLGWDEIAVVYVDDDDLTAKAFALADNRTADLGSYDNDALATLLTEVSADFNLLLASGYSADDLSTLLESVTPQVLPPTENDESIPESVRAKTIAGDVWLLGPHRLKCGDSRNPTDVDQLLNGARINLAVTSPPYAEQRTYDESSGFKPIPPDKYVDWFEMVQANVAANLADDGSWFVNIKAAADGLDRSLYVMDLVSAHVRQWGWHFADEFCWERNGVPKSPVLRFKNNWEPVFQFARNRWKFRPDNVRHASDSIPISASALGIEVGDTNWADAQGNKDIWAAKRNNLAIQKKIKKRKNGTTEFMADVQGTAKGAGEYMMPGLAYPSNRLPTFSGSHEATGHPAAFPVGLPEFFVKAYTDEGDTVYDPFMGSGSTILAAHSQNRVAYGMEISPAYCDIICARFQKATGILPIAESTGNSHDFLAE